MSEPSGALDIAFVEGSICRREDRERLRSIRRRSAVLVALGACADNGGVNALGSDRGPELLRQQVYASDLAQLQTDPPQPLSAVVPVDYRFPAARSTGRNFWRSCRPCC
jgi:coenzyme F420-reducing hydrogenase gamma subunit